MKLTNNGNKITNLDLTDIECEEIFLAIIQTRNKYLKEMDNFKNRYKSFERNKYATKAYILDNVVTKIRNSLIILEEK